ncbi:MAG: ATP-binding protein, partial [Candidatus Babeliales bacterium]
MSSQLKFFFSLSIILVVTFVEIKSIDFLDPDVTTNSNFNYDFDEDSSQEYLWGEPPIPLFPSDKRRYEIIDSFFYWCGKVASDDLIEDIVKLTTDFTMGQITDILINIVDSTSEGCIDRSICLEVIEEAINKIDSVEETNKKFEQHKGFSLNSDLIKGDLNPIYGPHIYFPKADERLDIIKETLNEHNKFANDSLIQSIVKQTDNLDIVVCRNKIADIVESLSTENDVYDTSLNNKDTQYPLIKDVIHPDRNLFNEVAKRLKIGKFEDTFRRGMLFYGPPGVGKTEMVKAIGNESNCSLFKLAGSEIVTGYKGSGSASIQEIFFKAKSSDPSKGIIIFIDELERLAPRTMKEDIQFAYPYEGQEEGNALTQLWIEYDNCLENHANIFVVVATNKFEVVDKRIRDRFMCIEFSSPNQVNAYKILKNKAQHYNVSLTDAELQHLVKKMKGLSGRELTAFIQDVEINIVNGMSKEKALKLISKKQEKTKKNAESSSKRFEQLTDEMLK